MGLFSVLKAIVGLSDSGSRRRGRDEGGLATEAEPRVESEAAVKGTEEPASGTEEPDAEETADADSGTESEAETDTEEEPAATVADDLDADADVEVVSGIGPSYAERLGDAGIETVGDLAAADAESVAAETDLSPKRVSRWIASARGEDE